MEITENSLSPPLDSLLRLLTGLFIPDNPRGNDLFDSSFDKVGNT